ncbi:transcriptional regulator with XRE-family HTH domain [Pullulanibacillus pueri]|uniref:Transcriptional regulator n=1 Tax=Pullulanibacillus pueri TaxID=1437324 RepID=A0A8J2ZZA7_9BACL|nr:XRE family transcriptional regulator [Pullulanibacillus pueri]MBM7680470.1 transcriptional regulator with XRE-family HTH domain [Pullulanibacillus pueri]GGH88163.1 transcriptional regulator [Pullulanibacillus pueri]
MEKDNLNHIIGKRLKAMRLERGLSLDKVAELTGVSKPMLGQIERARSNPTVSTLWKIAEGLRVPFTSFIEEIKKDVTLVKELEVTPIKEDHERYKVYPIFPMKGQNHFEMYKIDLLPTCHYNADPHPHGVEEYLWVYKGQMNIHIGSNTYTVSEGEGIRYQADQPHSYINTSTCPASLIMVIAYPVLNL